MTAESTNNNTPSHFAYQVQKQDGKKTYWRRVGSAWQHDDGNGFNIVLDALPLNGRITLRLSTETRS